MIVKTVGELKAALVELKVDDNMPIVGFDGETRSPPLLVYINDDENPPVLVIDV